MLEGRNLAPKDTSGLSDPYVKILLGEQKAVTQKVEQTLDPAWGETFYLYAPIQFASCAGEVLTRLQ